MKFLKKLLTSNTFLLVSLLPAMLFAQPQIRKVGDSIVDAVGLTIFSTWGPNINAMTYQQDAHISHLGWQYVAYYDKDRHVCLARRRLLGGAWQTIRFVDYTMTASDSHNTISLGICPKDGTIHLSFDHHVDPLHYRVSQKSAANNPDSVAWNASLFGPVQSKLGSLTVPSLTYPKFFQTPDGGLQFCMRQGGSGGGDRMLYNYDPSLSDWKLVGQFDSRSGSFTDVWGTSTRRNSYPNGYDYDASGRLHTTWCWREGSWPVNHDLMYAYSDDKGKTWHNSSGTLLTLPMRVNSPGLVAVPISTRYGLVNDQAQAIDSHGRVHVVMSHSQLENDDLSTYTRIGWASPGGARYHHYWRNTNGAWSKIVLPWASGNRPKLLADPEDNLFLIYQSGGKLYIARATSAAIWKDWKVVTSEYGPFFNEMLADRVWWKENGMISVIVQETPAKTKAPSAVRILDYYYGLPNSARDWNLYGQPSDAQR